MSQKSLSNLSDIATEETNTTGVMDPILSIDPDQGTMLRLLQNVLGGHGIPVYQDLRDGANNPLPDDTSYVLLVERPTMDQPQPVSVEEDNIASWNKLTVAEQQNEENRDAARTELKGRRVNIRYKDTLYVAIGSSAQIDWTNSELYFERQGVQEQPFDG
jgi:hypothetical protein